MWKELSRNESRAFERVKGLLFLRQAGVLVSLAVILVSQAERGVFQTDLLPTYLLLVFVCLVNLGYLVVIRRIRHVRRFAAVQICLDVVFASLLIYLNGAGVSNITFLYFACILAASSILGLGAGVMVASMAAAMLAGMKTLTFLAGHYGWELPWVASTVPHTVMLGISSSVSYLMAQAIAYYLVAVLAGRLAHGLSGVRLLNEKILENITDAVLVLDNARRVRSVNREAMRLLGLFGGTPVVGRVLDEVLRSSRNGPVLADLFRKRQHGLAQVTLTTSQGLPAPVAITASPLRDERGARLGLVVMFVDLTERRRMEEAVARAETMEMMGQLAASIAHEIRNPLACIRGSAQELRSELSHDGEAARLADLMVRESDRINAIITEFLHFSRMRRTALARCNLTEVVSDVVTMLEGRTADDRISIGFDGGEPVFCLGDVEQLRQVFLNLGLNALDAMNGGGRLDIRISRRDAGHSSAGGDDDVARVAVEFTDHGEGMTDEVRTQLFQPFFTTKPRGTGLGLAIVRRIVEAHRGQVEVDSAPGRGSTFRVVLEACVTGELQVSHV